MPLIIQELYKTSQSNKMNRMKIRSIYTVIKHKQYICFIPDKLIIIMNVGYKTNPFLFRS